MPNYIETAEIFQRELDAAMVEESTTGWMELNEDLIQYDGGKKVNIPRLDMDGLGDYENGAPEGAVRFEYQTVEMTQDRGRLFIFDEHTTNDTNYALIMASVMGEFQRTKVVPETDAYRYSTIGSLAIQKGKATGGYTPDEATILKNLLYDIAAVQDVVGDIPLVLTMSTMVGVILDGSSTISKKLDVTGFRQGNIDLKVQALNGQHPIIRAGSGRMKTEYTFYDGRTASDGTSPDQTAGGYTPTADAKDINWIICPRNVPLAVSRTDAVRIFDPQTYQKSRSWAADYRKFHDLWVKENSWNAIRVNIKQALA